MMHAQAYCIFVFLVAVAVAKLRIKKELKKKSFLAKVKLGKVPTTSLRFVCRAPN